MSKSQYSVTFDYGLSTSDPETSPVLIVGQVPHLKALKWDDVRRKLEPRVTELVWNRALQCVTNSPGDKVELWPRGAMLASLPLRCSRHVGSARGYALSKIVKEHRMGTNVHIVLVCRKTAVFASAAAIARALPAFSARSCLASLSSANQPPPSPPEAKVEVFLINERIGYDPEDGDNDYLSDSTLTNEDFVALTELAHGVRMAARITDMPCNMCDVDTIIQEATKVAQELNIKPPTIIRGEELRDRGFGGIYGVGKAAVSAPALVVLSWQHDAATETVAWVGKGIVYDTGGLSLKSRLAMVGMKSDCGGAAAVLGAFRSFVCHRPTVNLHAVLCVAENAVGPNATRPDDIHTLYSGRTVEINNTDAEGRLVLSDGVVYAHKDLGATTIVDVATLTGAQGTATGKYHAAILSNSEGMEAAAVRAGRLAGDCAHALPFAPELHFCEFSSSVADMTNSVADRNNAQPSCAGLFILAHLGFDFPGTWLHVDMAAPAHAGDRATGYGVALLSVLFGKYANNKLLQNLSTLFK